MADSIKYRKKQKKALPFYGGVKSSDEIYFQMVSLFKEVTKGKSDLSGKWMHRILTSRISNSPGKNFIDNI